MLIKRSSPTELSEQRAKGLCFNCNEKFGPGHRCKKLFLIEGSWPNDGEDEHAQTEIDTTDEVPEISINAIYGVKTPQTKCVQGRLGQQRVTFLIDFGSTHNFLKSNIARKKGLTPSSEGKLEVVAICRVPQGVPLVVDLYLLPLEGCDTVLGAQWLSMLGPITWDFSKLQMAFILRGKEVILQGLKPADNRVVETNEISKDMKKRKERILLQINSLSMKGMQGNSAPEFSPQFSNHQLDKMLHSFKDVFKEPQGLPPKRTHDHHSLERGNRAALQVPLLAKNRD
ncbi:hypothetical protein AMTRI_Chr07g25150 [Amborella trichopoda]